MYSIKELTNFTLSHNCNQVTRDLIIFYPIYTDDAAAAASSQIFANATTQVSICEPDR